ncbi:hypothetical protein HMPREF9946_03718 [Acetobacteraceae bacterium AT-5844]|nr:hypothetical protein HMPREF9946_03718 [Acetobacteraceae bacterium AT-5844]
MGGVDPPRGCGPPIISRRRFTRMPCGAALQALRGSPGPNRAASGNGAVARPRHRAFPAPLPG